MRINLEILDSFGIGKRIFFEIWLGLDRDEEFNRGPFLQFQNHPAYFLEFQFLTIHLSPADYVDKL